MPEDDKYVSLMKNLPHKRENLYKKTIIFDLDETLIISGEENEFSTTVPVYADTPFKVHIRLRPYAKECLAEASRLFEVFIFTASQRNYADAIIDHLDPEGTLIQQRLYRDDCILTAEGFFLKDLRIINRSLEKIVIVDNSVWSFARQLDNGIPVQPWSGDPFDVELRNLIPYLKVLDLAKDVRVVNRETFRLEGISGNDGES